MKLEGVEHKTNMSNLNSPLKFYPTFNRVHCNTSAGLKIDGLEWNDGLIEIGIMHISDFIIANLVLAT